MAQANFLGIWNVLSTAGTNFGIGSTVTIGAAGGEQVSVIIVAPVAVAGLALPGTYNPATDAIKIESATRTMFISRYFDESQGFYALYGLAIETGTGTLSVWMAQAAGVPSVALGVCPEPGFDGTYTVRSTVDAQFGTGSPVLIVASNITITNALSQQNVPGPTALVFDAWTCSLQGSATVDDQPIVLQVSVASHAGRRYLYGLALVGDPQQAGTWGAEDNEGP